MIRTFAKILSVCLIVGALGACSPPHYSVAVASSADRVVYAQRHPGTSDDYLVDCEMVNDVPQNCQTIQLQTED